MFLSSHLLSEVEQLCTRVGIVDRGRLVLQDDLANLRAPTGHILVESPDAAAGRRRCWTGRSSSATANGWSSGTPIPPS